MECYQMVGELREQKKKKTSYPKFIQCDLFLHRVTGSLVPGGKVKACVSDI